MIKLLLLLLPAVVTLPLNVSRISIGTTYSDTVARNVMMPLSAAAYASNPQPCLTKILGAQLKRIVTSKCDGFSDVCSGYSAVTASNKAIILSFRGTDQFFQLVDEITSGLGKKVKFVSGGSVEYYFYNAFEVVWNGGMKDDFLTLLQQNPGFDVWITGHSLGGSMASIAASYIVGTGIIKGDKVKLMTFGQPRTGDSTFAHNHDSAFPYSYRITHSHDVVPHVPLEKMGYKHHMSEVWYSNDDMGPGAKFIECDADESNKCSDGNTFDTSISEHLQYFNKVLNVWGAENCN